VASNLFNLFSLYVVQILLISLIAIFIFTLLFNYNNESPPSSPNHTKSFDHPTNDSPP
jgi:hypothetical protein